MKNYLELINSFWKQHRNEQFCANDWFVYSYLLNEANRLFWPASFSVSTNIVCAELGISRSTFLKVRNKLKQKNLIGFMEGGRRKKPVYSIRGVQQTNAEPGTVQVASTADRVAEPEKNSPSVGKEHPPEKPANVGTAAISLPEGEKIPPQREQTDGPEKGKKEDNGFNPPSIEEVAAMFRERDNGLDPVRFHAYYSANGWMVGRNRMKSWAHAVTIWERNEKKWKAERPPERQQTNGAAEQRSKIGRTPMETALKNASGW